MVKRVKNIVITILFVTIAVISIPMKTYDIMAEDAGLIFAEPEEFILQSNIDIVVVLNGIPYQRTVSTRTTVADVIVQLQNEYFIAFLYDGDTSEVLQGGEILFFDSWESYFIDEIEYIPYEITENKTNSVRAGLSYVRRKGIPG